MGYIVAIIWILLSIVVAFMAHRNNLNYKVYFILSLLLTPIAALYGIYVETGFLGLKKDNEKEEEEQKKEEEERKRIEEENKAKRIEYEKKLKEKVDEYKEKFGKKFGKEIYYGRHKKGMSIEQAEECDRSNNVFPKYKNNKDNVENWYYNKSKHIFGFDLLVSFKNKKIIKVKKPKDGIWLDMKKQVLIKACGRPKDEKKSVSKQGVKLKWYYQSRITRQGTTVYGYEVVLEDDMVVAWKEIE